MEALDQASPTRAARTRTRQGSGRWRSCWSWSGPPGDRAAATPCSSSPSASWPWSSPTPRCRSGSTLWQGAFYDAIEHRALAAVRPPAPGVRRRRRRAAGARRRPDLAAGDAQGQAARVADPRPDRPVAGAQARLPAGLRRPGRRQPRPAHAGGRAHLAELSADLARRPAAVVAAARQLRRRAVGALGARRVRVRPGRFTDPGLHGLVRARLRARRLLARLARSAGR